MKTNETAQTRTSHNEAMIASYSIQVSPLAEEEGGGFQALFPPLVRSIVGYGSTPEAAIADLHTTIPLFLKRMDKIEQILPVAAPEKDWDDFSGKFNVRVAKVLHAQLVELAEDQGISLNSLVQTILASGATALTAGKMFGAVEQSDPKRKSHDSWHQNTDSTAIYFLDESFIARQSIMGERAVDSWLSKQEN